MRYYCKGCGLVSYTTQDTPSCPVCSNGTYLTPYPVYETVSQWEGRTGSTYPASAPVYLIANGRWTVTDYADSQTFQWVYSQGNSPIVATERGAPPDTWRAGN